MYSTSTTDLVLMQCTVASLVYLPRCASNDNFTFVITYCENSRIKNKNICRHSTISACVVPHPSLPMQPELLIQHSPKTQVLTSINHRSNSSSQPFTKHTCLNYRYNTAQCIYALSKTSLVQMDWAQFVINCRKRLFK
jgi:hypothetical protein